jgi:septum formation protein
VRIVPIDETPPKGVIPREAARQIAVRKAEAAAAAEFDDAWVIGADTMVEVGGEILGKPKDAADALRMLGLLSGSRHHVHTGVAIVDTASGLRVDGVCTTEVVMRPITAAERRAYVDSAEPFDKAGGYAVQETGDRFVVTMDGPYDNVVGLPVDLVRELLVELGSRTS